MESVARPSLTDGIFNAWVAVKWNVLGKGGAGGSSIPNQDTVFKVTVNRRAK